jgi:hypothetical protein
MEQAQNVEVRVFVKIVVHSRAIENHRAQV